MPPLSEGGIGQKGAEKLSRAFTAGAHMQIGLNCIDCGPSTAGRTTVGSMARQRSGRLKGASPAGLHPTNAHLSAVGGRASALLASLDEMTDLDAEPTQPVAVASI